MNKSLLFKIVSLSILIFNAIMGCILITFMCLALFKIVVLNSLYFIAFLVTLIINCLYIIYLTFELIQNKLSSKR